MKVSVLSLILLPLLGAAVYAQAPAPATTTTPPGSEQQAALAPLQADPQLMSGRLENGLNYLIRPTREPAGQACMRLYVDTGSLNESEETKGISHFIEHMVFNGSRHFKRGELIPAMQKLGLGFGGDANAYTALLQTVYKLDLPNLKPETVEFALTILRDFADGATLTDEAIDHERGIIVSELKARDSESYRADIKLLRHLVGGTRVPDYLPIGTEEVIKNCPYETIRQYYRDNYIPARMTLIITGDIDPQQARQGVEAHFGSMEARPNPPRPDLGTPETLGAGYSVISNAETANTTLTLTVVNPWQAREDSLEQRVDDLPLQFASFMLNRRLSRIARQADSPFLYAGLAPQDEVYQSAELFSLAMRSQPEQWQQALACAEAELRRAARYGFSPSELQEVIATIDANCRQSEETWDTISAPTVADALVDTLDEKSLFTTPQEDRRAYAIGIARILQNPDICRQALAEAYDATRARLSLSGKLPQGVTEDTLAEAYAHARAQEVAPPEEQQLVPFTYDHVGEPGSVVNMQTLDDVGVTMLTLSNGVRVNLKPVDFKKGSISVDAAVDGGSMRLPKVPGLAHMVGAVMSQGGLEAHSADDLNRLFAGNNVSNHFDISDERFLFSGDTTPQELELQCKLLCAAIMHPGYRNEGELRLRRSLPAFFRKLETTPSGAYNKQSLEKLFGDDVRFITPTAEQFAAVDTAQVKAAMEPFLRNGAIEVTLVGDFKVEDVLPILERSFGAMPQRSPEFSPIAPEERRVTFRPWGQREWLRYTTELDKTIVTQVRPAGNGRDRHRNRRLGVLKAIVRERLFNAIRAELGESYSPSVTIETRGEYEDAATITASSYGVKRNREKVTAAMDIVFSSLGKGDISEEEFQQALLPIIADAEEALRKDWFWVGMLMQLQSDPQALDLLRDHCTDTRNISLEEIRALAREIFSDAEKVNYYFTMPQEDAPAKQQEAAAPTAPYGIVVLGRLASEQNTAAVAPVVSALQQKYADAHCFTFPQAEEKALAEVLRQHGIRYVAFIVAPEDIDHQLVNTLHRASRMVDDDPWGDCLWGIITGASPADMERVAAAKKPLTIKRLLGTTNVHAAPFEQSYCITDWTNAPVLHQKGGKEPETQHFDEGEGREQLFAEQLENEKPQLLVTSSHATPFNLEMPFGKGLIFPAKGKFHLLTAQQMSRFGAPLGAAMKGDTSGLNALAESLNAPAIEPDGEPRVWLAAGNCLFGNAWHSAGSMVVTAMAAYNCNQVVGYTVPSWYGKGGWGTLSLLLGNVDGGSLAEAWFLNNQFILQETQAISPELLKEAFHDAEMTPAFLQQVQPALLRLCRDSRQAQEALGLIHDRDVVAFYGDPAWRASVDSSLCPRPLRVEWKGEKEFTLTALSDHKGRAAVWFPNAATGKDATGCDAEGAIFTNDFILWPELTMDKGETLTVKIQ